MMHIGVMLFPTQHPVDIAVVARKSVVSLNCCDEVLSAEYHNIRASQGMKVS